MAINKTKKVKRRQVNFGVVCINAGFNNTIVSVTDVQGNVITSSSSGQHGFKGSKKATPYVAQVVVNDALTKCKEHYGVKAVKVQIKGPGIQRDSAIRAACSFEGIAATAIEDKSPIAHNGVRSPKRRKI